VLLCIAHDPGVRLRDIAARVGVTERTAYGIVTDLTEAGYVVKQKDGRRNRYQDQAHLPLRRPLPMPDSRGLAAVGEVLALLTGVSVSVGAAGLSARDEGPVARWPTAASQEQAMTDAPSMAGKYVLVTGGTGGIGKATATGLAALGARVGITGRDQGRAAAAAADIRAATGNHAVDICAAGMSAQAEVRRLAAQVLGTYPRLEVLVNDAGGFWARWHVAADGLEHTFALNHLAPFLLTNLLLDRLTASAPARIVTVSCGAHAQGRLDFNDLQGERNYSGQQAYSQSKLANVLFTYQYDPPPGRHRRHRHRGAPGVVATSFGAEDHAAHLGIMICVARPLMNTPSQGPLTPVYLAFSPVDEGITGQYFAHRKPKASSKALLPWPACSRPAPP
jgi:retinol dehydrogenase 14